jgi:Carboxypeptidase regulatory-like domain/TonB dependent receptor
MSSKRVVVVLCCLFVLVCISSPKAFGQSTGTVSGTVTDSSGSVVAGATVTLNDAATAIGRPTTTNDKGFYVFAYVNPGSYTVSVTKQGFRTSVISSQTVEVGLQLSINVVLEVGSVSSTVEVTYTAGAELQTMDATVGATLSGETLVNLPNTSRDASTLAVLQPGQNINGNVGGNASDQNSFQLDGGYATDDMSRDNNTYIRSFSSDTAGGVGGYHSPGFSQAPSAVIPIPVSSVEEFKVATANQTADFNGGAGSQVQIVTKRGTNSFHGGVYEYYLDTNFGGANTWDNNRTGTKQPSAHLHRFGADAGGKIPHSDFLGGSWYIFGNYEGFRDPLSATFEESFPTAAMRAGLLQLNGEVINLNQVPTALPGSGTIYAANAATCVAAAGCNKGAIAQGAVIPCTGTGGCDPRHLGLNPVIKNLWNTYLPLPNDCSHGDGLNYCGYKGTIATPQSSNFGVARVDHDFAKGWHFNGTYHYYKLSNTVSDQWDVGGFFPGDAKGQYAAIRSKPQNTWLYTAGLTKEIRPNLTNDFHFSFTRNWWAYADPSGVPNVAGYPAALEIGGETANPYGPYNTNNQSVRTRYWNGHDSQYRDDLTWIKSSHLIQIGGSYLRNNDTHKRNDNGGTINTYEQYLIGEGNGVSLASQQINMAGYVPAGVSANKYGNLYSMVLGMVDSTQGLFTRGLGSQANGLPLNPSASCAISGVAATANCTSSPAVSADSIIPTYNVYWTDSWRVKPKFTLNYGIGYTVEMPPFETTGGFQTVLVDQNDHIQSAEQYLNNVKQAALQGQAYAPALGFATIGNVQGANKYPYNPFYGGVSPRVGAAWNFTKDTVLRAGYARIFGRINGVNPLLVPLLTPGLLQPATCGGPGAPSIVGNNTTCGGTTPASVFRVGVDCPATPCVAPLPAPVQNLPQPWYPGVNGVATGAGETFDPNFKPNRSDEFTVTIQHQFGSKILAEAGYIGRKISNEIEYYSLTSVPYMMTLGGQSFANAWKNVMVSTNYGTNVPAALAAQPFFEAAIKPAYCVGFANCTTAFAMKNGANGNGNMTVSDAFDAWASVSNTGNFVFGRSFTSDPINSPFGANGQSPSLATTVSNGYGNYNAGFLQFTVSNWHGLTMKSNFTMSKALGTGNVVQASSSFSTVDPFNIQNDYGLQSYDEKFNFNLFLNYQPPFFTHQKGVLGRVLGGWNISPLFVYGSGFPVEVNTSNGDCGTLGECNTAYVGAFENMIVGHNLSYTASRHQGVFGASCGTAGAGQNVLTNPDASCPINGGIFGDPVRNPILGLDGQIGGFQVRGLPLWNLDVGLSKRIQFTERISSSVHFDFTNVLNHMQPADPCFNGYDTTTWGVLGCGGNVQANTPRRMQLGLTIDW